MVILTGPVPREVWTDKLKKGETRLRRAKRRVGIELGEIQ